MHLFLELSVVRYLNVYRSAPARESDLRGRGNLDVGFRTGGGLDVHRHFDGCFGELVERRQQPELQQAHRGSRLRERNRTVSRDGLRDREHNIGDVSLGQKLRGLNRVLVKRRLSRRNAHRELSNHFWQWNVQKFLSDTRESSHAYLLLLCFGEPTGSRIQFFRDRS